MNDCIRFYEAYDRVIRSYQPHEAAIEQVFMHENPNSALKLGQARGAAIVALTNARHGIFRAASEKISRWTWRGGIKNKCNSW